MINCKYCKEEVEKKDKRTRFCNLDCYRNFNRSNSSLIKYELRILICKNCNKKSETRRPKKQFCNIDCNKEYRKKQLKQIDCPTCNKNFKPKRREQRFCSIKCSKPRKNEYHFYNCKGCNELFESRHKDTTICRKCKETKYKDKYLAGRQGTWCLYKEIKVMSTYELRACNIFDKLKELNLIYDWEYTADKIPYIGTDNEWHNYFLDFKIFENENDFYYIETKGYAIENDYLKWQATRNKGYRLDVWYIEDIREKELELIFTKDDINYLLSNCIIRE